MPRNGVPRSTTRRTVSTSSYVRRLSMQAPNAPTPGSTTPSARSIAAASRVTVACAPMRSKPFCTERRLPMP